MRAAREQPRVVMAEILACLCLLAAGIAVGAVIERDNGDTARATQVRTTTAEQSARDRHAELEQSKAELKRVLAGNARARHALERLRRVNRRLRRDLYMAERSLRQARRRR